MNNSQPNLIEVDHEQLTPTIKNTKSDQNIITFVHIRIKSNNSEPNLIEVDREQPEPTIKNTTYDEKITFVHIRLKTSNF